MPLLSTLLAHSTHETQNHWNNEDANSHADTECKPMLTIHSGTFFLKVDFATEQCSHQKERADPGQYQDAYCHGSPKGVCDIHNASLPEGLALAKLVANPEEGYSSSQAEQAGHTVKFHCILSL